MVVHSEWRQWINAKYFDGEQLGHLEHWYAQPHPDPLGLEQFLVPEKAALLSGLVRRLPNWEREYSVQDGEGRIAMVGEAEWHATEPRSRWNRQDIARPPASSGWPSLNSTDKETFNSFLRFFLVGRGFKSWLETFLQRPLGDRVTCEFARYQTEDYLAPHSDAHDERVVGVNLYLGQAWRPSFGGRLGHRNGDKPPTYVCPHPNSLSVFPVQKAALHWVEPWSLPHPGRETISMSFAP